MADERGGGLLGMLGATSPDTFRDANGVLTYSTGVPVDPTLSGISDRGGGGGVGSPGPAPPPAQGQDGQNYAPQWVIDQWNQTPEAAPPTEEQQRAGGGTGPTRDQLGAMYNPANWGPPPTNAQEAATGGFWSIPDVTGSALANTSNWRLLGGQPGDYMTQGRYISAAKRQYDLHRPVTDPATAGSFHYAPQYGPGMYWSTTGELGIPGQLDPFATLWGAGGPGSG